MHLNDYFIHFNDYFKKVVDYLKKGCIFVSTNKQLNIKIMTDLNITKLEKEVLDIISWGDEYEETPTECFDEIFASFKGSKNQLKGVIGSLEKKQLIWLGEYPNGLTSYHLDCEM